MQVFGCGKENEQSAKLSEIIINCSKEELDQIIVFLQDIRREISEQQIEEAEHWHYRDYCEIWKEGEPDLIIFLENNIC